jgi:hypothetical protein
MSFEKPTDAGRLTIGSLSEPSADNTVEAQFNPAQLEVGMSAKWAPPAAATGKGAAGAAKSGKAAKPGAKTSEDDIALEFSGAEGRSLTLELLFDGFEKNESVEPKVSTLARLATIRKPNSMKDDERLPHQCVVTWPPIGKFKCVIESLTTKYSMFGKDGTPLRATCTVKLKEANTVTKAAKK